MNVTPARAAVGAMLVGVSATLTVLAGSASGATQIVEASCVGVATTLGALAIGTGSKKNLFSRSAQSEHTLTFLR